MTDKPPIVDPYDGRKIRPHPAKFSDVLLDHIIDMIPHDIDWITDPMAGVGKITQLSDDFLYHCNELEPEWGSQIEADIVTIGDARDMEINPKSIIVTSPPYGNRMADCFVSKRPSSMKGRYAGDLGRRLSDGNTGSLHFGPQYVKVITDIYESLFSKMVSGQFFLLNISNFIRAKKEVNVVGFYLKLFSDSNFILSDFVNVSTPRDRGRGANADLRVDHEVLILWRKL